ncbi:hypothetical protein [Actinoallomurus soli]|uniref:hypothetical protein n=1 Tax=Actinoallomurus soli TaxID=2952535 RepID=UPI0020924E4B|nr:hypothetical protein [Actinoallomurus soli]MCO5972724.1 hypothetical protein [Actinoallomurus soli]
MTPRHDRLSETGVKHDPFDIREVLIELGVREGLIEGNEHRMLNHAVDSRWRTPPMSKTASIFGDNLKA